jgi:uncharacterized metal-binding protein YceD (DUF177 family)
VKILFDKVGSSPKPVALKSQGVCLEGTLEKSGYHRVALNASLQGQVDLICDRCGKAYRQEIDQKLTLSLSDQVIEDKDDLDIIEFLDGEIDILYILESEITSIQSSYHYCDSCDNDDDFEMEF